MNITYHQIGDYLFPDLTVENKTTCYGKYGMLRKSYLREHRKGVYQSMLLSGKLEEHLTELDSAATERLEQITSRIAEAEGVTEELKADDPLAWAAQMNSIKSRAEEIVLYELIYT